MAQQRYWLLTVAAGSPAYAEFPPPAEYLGGPIQGVADHAITWLKGQRELGAGGLDHWQVIVGFARPQRLPRVRALFPGAHAEPTRSAAADEYVWKDDTAVPGTRFELGSKPHRRNNAKDWDAIWAAAIDGRLGDIPADVRLQHYSSIRRIRSDYVRPTAMERTVHVFWGRSGTGKSRRAWDEAGMDCYPKPPTTVWWDGYQGHGHVVVDEFCGLIGITHLLRWLDRYPCMVEFKGGATALGATEFWFTSNIDPDEWYNDSNSTAEQRVALRRRFNEVVHFL